MSRTVRVSACLLTRPSSICPADGANELRPRRGLSPTRPQHEEASGSSRCRPPRMRRRSGRAATAAADPPLDPPGEASWFHGFRVGPDSAGSVAQWLPNSGVFVRPQMISPAARYRSTVHAVSVATWSRSAREPIRSGRPGLGLGEILEQERHARQRTRLGGGWRRPARAASNWLVDEDVELAARPRAGRSRRRPAPAPRPPRCGRARPARSGPWPSARRSPLPLVEHARARRAAPRARRASRRSRRSPRTRPRWWDGRRWRPRGAGGTRPTRRRCARARRRPCRALAPARAPRTPAPRWHAGAARSSPSVPVDRGQLGRSALMPVAGSRAIGSAVPIMQSRVTIAASSVLAPAVGAAGRIGSTR